MDSTPGSIPDSKPGSKPGSTPDSTPDTNPGSIPNSTPDINPDSTPGSNPGSKPGSKPGSIPDSTPDTNPGSIPNSTPDINPGSNPGSKPEQARPGGARANNPSYARWLALLITLVALVLAWPGGLEPVTYPDSASYLRWPADYVLPGGLRVMGSRPPTYPLILKLTGAGASLGEVQTLVSVLAWCTLGWSVARASGVALAALLALGPVLWKWNVLVLSESLSFSLTAASLGATLQLARGWSPGRFVWWALLLVALAGIRDTNAWLLPFLVFPALMPWDSRAARATGGTGATPASPAPSHSTLRSASPGSRLPFALRRLAIVLVALSAAGMSMWSARAADRWQWNIGNVITARVLPNVDAREAFIRSGMPISPAVLAQAGRSGSSTRRALLADAPAFATWLNAHGLTTYQRWLLTRSSSYLEAWQALEQHMQARPDYARGIPLPAASVAGRYLYRWVLPLELWLCIVLLPLAGWWRRGALEPIAVLAAVLVPATFVQAYVTFHGDATEVPRHMLSALLLYRVAGWTAVAAIFSLARPLRSGDRYRPGT